LGEDNIVAKSKEQLEVEIANTLRAIVYVPPLPAGILMANEEFWNRCQLITPNWRHQRPDAIFVDGFVGGCKWNSNKVFTDALKPGLRIFQGYAFGLGSWAEHCWCMLGNRIVESTGDYDVYYGAELNAQERQWFQEGAAAYNPLAVENPEIWTLDIGGSRIHVPYKAERDAASIGRERHWRDRKLKEGLGHPDPEPEEAEGDAAAEE
jgi:hypothetical protein